MDVQLRDQGKFGRGNVGGSPHGSQELGSDTWIVLAYLCLTADRRSGQIDSLQ
jgi:hypothetical protein